MEKKTITIQFANKVIDKHELKQVIVWAFRKFGIARAANMVDQLKDLGFYYATKAGISLSIEDLRIPPAKTQLLTSTLNSIENTDYKHKRGEITAVERFQKVIDTWNSASENLKREVVQYFKNTDPLNPIYMMAFSGARGNISQVRQLVGMRGLMSDPQGQIIDLPIASNFREGLTITDYFISSYGARKGLVDTALRTADSGYLTRRLVDVSQDIIIREDNCKTNKGILLESMVDSQKVLIGLKQSLIGRVLAENLIDPISGHAIAYTNQAIGPLLADKILESGRHKILVRSPLTCDSIRSVCQLCYGWNLAHGKMVDLGEAVGIIAAQSIGEPGTQLTMRTFHTGGVFTGELAHTILSPIEGQVIYFSDIDFAEVRNRHGESAFLVNSDCKLKLIDFSNNPCFVTLSKGMLLRVKNNHYVKQGQILAEYPLSYRSITERAQKIVVSDFSGVVDLSNLSVNQVGSKHNFTSNAKHDGILWILSGVVHNIPDDAQLMVVPKQKIYKDSLLARTQLISRYSGRVAIKGQSNDQQTHQISIITSCKIFSNIKVYMEYANNYENYILETVNKDKFMLKVDVDSKITNGQILGDLISDVYKTNTGGIIKYLDLPVSSKTVDLHHEYYNILNSGYILWIPEETHEISKDMSSLLVNEGDFVEVGTEIIKNVFANNSGILEVVQKDGIIQEIVIKPGTLYSIDHDLEYLVGKHRGFLRPGQHINKYTITDKLVFWEYTKSSKHRQLIIRPVVVYSVPRKFLSGNFMDDSFGTDIFNVEVVRRTMFKDGARIKSVHGVNLVTTHLIAKIHHNFRDMHSYMEFVPNPVHKFLFFLKLITADLLSFKETKYINNQKFYTRNRLQVSQGQYIASGSVISETEILSSIDGVIEYIQESPLWDRRILVLNSIDLRVFNIKNDQLVKIKVNDWVYMGDEVATSVKSSHSGKILTVRDNQILMQIGRPYRISKGSMLHVSDKALIKRGENIATLIFERAKTGDIVQGLPRIEEILEGRKKADDSFNPHTLLDFSFRLYMNQGLGLYDATKLSLLQVQLFLVKEVQLVYQAQGVDIADKHIEVIVKQMTSKVKIEKGGATGFLPGEMLDLHKIEAINHSLAAINKEQASYYPVILGITKASLNTESFISAASFQETTKVLTEAAISGKIDWLRGLKENVIIGRLIPAGTGFNIYNSPALHPEKPFMNKNKVLTNDQKDVPSSKFEDIILDDRTARNYPNIFQHNNISDEF